MTAYRTSHPDISYIASACLNLPDLPTGVTRDISNNYLRYHVRFMFKGKRVNLGTFYDLNLAIDCMIRYKSGVLTKDAIDSIANSDVRSQQARMKDSVLAIEMPANAAGTQLSTQSAIRHSAPISMLTADMQAAMLKALESVPPHELMHNTPATINGMDIPASIVTQHLDAIYGVINNEVRVRHHEQPEQLENSDSLDDWQESTLSLDDETVVDKFAGGFTAPKPDKLSSEQD